MKSGLVLKGLVLGIIMLFIGAGVIPSMGGTVLEKTTSTAIGSPGYIQDLIDNASDGDTIYIPSGTYYENIIINKSISLVGVDKETTIIDGRGIGDVVYISADKVNLSGFRIQNSRRAYGSDAGIDIRSNYNTITGNNLLDSAAGIYLRESDSNSIKDNNIYSNISFGISLWQADFNTLSGNIISNNTWSGIRLRESRFNIIKRNIISNIKNYGIYLLISRFNIILKNNFLENKQDAFFSNSFFNRWWRNYWNKPRVLLKLIPGSYQAPGLGPPATPPLPLPWINIDWLPAKQPYDI